MGAGQILRQDPRAAGQFGGCRQIAVVKLRGLADKSAGAVHRIGLVRASEFGRSGYSAPHWPGADPIDTRHPAAFSDPWRGSLPAPAHWCGRGRLTDRQLAQAWLACAELAWPPAETGWALTGWAGGGSAVIPAARPPGHGRLAGMGAAATAGTAIGRRMMPRAQEAPQRRPPYGRLLQKAAAR